MRCLVFSLRRKFYLLFNQVLFKFHYILVGLVVEFMVEFWIQCDIMLSFISIVHCDLILLCNNHAAWLNWWWLQIIFFPFRFRDSLESDTIVVHAIQSEHKISSYRLVKPSKYSKSKRPSQSERRASKFEGFEKEGTGRKGSQRDTGNLNDKKAFKSLFIKISKLNYLFVSRTFDSQSWDWEWMRAPGAADFLTSHVQLFLNLGFHQMLVFLGSVCSQIPGLHPRG